MEKTKKQNLTLALVLSFLVALVGSAIWGVMYYFGWFASIISYATAFGMFAVYMKFAKMSKLAFVWTLVWVILLDTIACFLSIVIAVSINAGVALSEAFMLTIDSFYAIAGNFAFDVIIGAVFGVLGVVTYYGAYKKTLKNKMFNEQIAELQAKQEQTTENVDEQNAVEANIVEEKTEQIVDNKQEQ